MSWMQLLNPQYLYHNFTERWWYFLKHFDFIINVLYSRPESTAWACCRRHYIATRGQKTHSGKYSVPYFKHYSYTFSSVLQKFHSASSVIPSRSCDTLFVAVDLEHEVFRKTNSSNLYKAAILKKVNTDCTVRHTGGRSAPELTSWFKGVRDEENSTWRRK